MLYFPIPSPAPAGFGSIIIYVAAPAAEGRWPKLVTWAWSPPACTSGVLTGGWEERVGTGEEGDVEAVGRAATSQGRRSAASGLVPDHRLGPPPSMAGASWGRKWGRGKQWVLPPRSLGGCPTPKFPGKT